HGLELFDVQKIPTHGGSLRIFAKHTGAAHENTANVAALLAEEERTGLTRLDHYEKFEERVHETKRQILEFLIQARRKSQRVVGYGAAGKTNTLLNFCGIREDFIEYFVDKNPYKQGKFLPGTHIPIRSPEQIAMTKPDYVFIGPWNLVN